MVKKTEKSTPLILANINRRNSIALRIRREVWERDNGQCHYCGSALPVPGNRKTTITQIDHIVSVAKGGSDDLSNLILACKVCNRHKGKKDYRTFLEEEILKHTKIVTVLEWRLHNVKSSQGIRSVHR
jgi:5-methylcytosine-specific restriction endonuclease McrA